MKEVIILRSVSGAGKSTAAGMLCTGRKGWVTLCADDFFMIDGEYKFDPEKLGAAHKACQESFVLFLNDPMVKGIVIANTNTKGRDFKFYEEWAAKAGARVFYFVVENRHGGKDIHNVPEASLKKQEEAIKNSLKLR